jgi:hypothetical protein
MTSRQAYISLASQDARALNIFTFTIQFHADVCQKMKITKKQCISIKLNRKKLYVLKNIIVSIVLMSSLV